MANSAQIFKLIIDQKDPRPIAIFDLDSTLYNVSYRTQRILTDFLRDKTYRNIFKNEISGLESVQVHSTDWGLKESLTRAQVSVSKELFQALKTYWQTHFFSTPYLQYDRPYEGASKFVNELKKNDIPIYYLTGRDHENMVTGTIESLFQHSFPINDPRRQLIMKPRKGISEDEDFKAEKLLELKLLNRPIWFFENEPVIINKVLKHHPDIRIVWVDTTHSRREEPPPNVYVIRDRWTTT